MIPMSNNTLNTVSNPSATDSTDLIGLLESLMSSGCVTLPDFAKAAGVGPESARRALIDHYGTRIEFRRGRKGGIYLNDQKNGDNA